MHSVYSCGWSLKWLITFQSTSSVEFQGPHMCEIQTHRCSKTICQLLALRAHNAAYSTNMSHCCNTLEQRKESKRMLNMTLNLNIVWPLFVHYCIVHVSEHHCYVCCTLITLCRKISEDIQLVRDVAANFSSCRLLQSTSNVSTSHLSVFHTRLHDWCGTHAQDWCLL